MQLTSPILLALVALFPSVAEGQAPVGGSKLLGPSTCAGTIKDQAQPGACLEAASTPTLGKLFPLSQDLYVEGSSGRVGLGTTFPVAKLDVRDGSTSPGAWSAFLWNGAPNGIALYAQTIGDSGSLSVLGTTYDTNGAGVVGANKGIAYLSGSGVAGSTDGSAPSTAGVVGIALDPVGDDYGVLGLNDSSTTGIGVGGSHSHSLGTGAGVMGTTYSTSSSASGVFGQVFATNPGGYSAGVRGLNQGVSSSGIGVYGTHAGAGWGVHGATASGRGVYGVSGSGTGVVGETYTGTYGVYSYGNLGATGVKSFIQPHPEDASKEIRFVCLEGNESGTYFRGSSRAQNGFARIQVPEDFRLASEATSLTVQVTARGPGELWVESSDLFEVVVRADRDVPFDYFVNGVRRGFADFTTIRENHGFVPKELGVPFGGQYPDALRSILVENGTLNADFTPSETTADRLGWTLEQPQEAVPPRSPRDEVELVRHDR